MNKTILIFFIILITFITEDLPAQFVINAEYRPRFEFRNGYKRLPDSTTHYAMLVSQRTRLSLGYSWKILQLKLTAQDVRLWGEEKLKSDNPALGVYEAWVRIRIFDSLSIKIGRQELIFGNQRLFSNNNWNQAGQVHDMALLKYSKRNYNLDLGCAFNQNKDTLWGTYYNSASVKNNYKLLCFLIISRHYKSVDYEILAAGDGFQNGNSSNSMYMRGTYGGSLQFSFYSVSPVFRGYYQNGKDATGKDISAFYLNTEVNIKPSKYLNFILGGEYFSGKNTLDTADTKARCFVPLYGSNHNFNGHMDYITDIPKHTGNSGLIDAYMKLSVKPLAKHQIFLDYHYFSLAKKYASTGVEMKRYYGHEIDFSWKWEIIREINLQAGYSFIYGSKTMACILGGDYHQTGHWAWCMLSVKPVLFNQ